MKSAPGATVNTRVAATALAPAGEPCLTCTVGKDIKHLYVVNNQIWQQMGFLNGLTSVWRLTSRHVPTRSRLKVHDP